MASMAKASMAELLRTDKLTQFATLSTFLLLFTSSKFMEGFGKSPSERRVQEHNKSLHYMMWRYSRDKFTSANMIRLRFLVTGLMTTLWVIVFLIHSFGVKESVSYSIGGFIIFFFICALIFFEFERGAVKTKEQAAIPVTIVTGWLGAGKTTMIKHLLQEAQDKKILVVENEAGSIGVDHELLVTDKDIGKEEVILLRNGCVCCSVRADLARVLKEQLSRNLKECQESLNIFDRFWINYLDFILPTYFNYTTYQTRNGWRGGKQPRPFDAILVETTGIALPSPIIQLFFADPEVRKQTRLDAVIAVVDGKHIWNHLSVRREDEVLHTSRGNSVGEVVVIGQEEVATQIAYADRIVINKIDLIEENEDKNDDKNDNDDKKQKVKQKKSKSLEAVCKAVRSLNPRADILKALNGKVALNQLLGIKAFDLKCQVIPAPLMVSDAAKKKTEKGKDEIREALSSKSDVQSPKSQSTGKFDENGVFRSNEFARFHRSTVETFTLVEESNDIDLDKFNEWVPTFLQEHGEKIYRLKGFIAAKGESHKLVCQGVHMTFTGERGEPWGSETRKSTLVIIGKSPLPRVEITAAFKNCAGLS